MVLGFTYGLEREGKRREMVHVKSPRSKCAGAPVGQSLKEGVSDGADKITAVALEEEGEAQGDRPMLHRGWESLRETEAGRSVKTERAWPVFSEENGGKCAGPGRGGGGALEKKSCLI